MVIRSLFISGDLENNKLTWKIDPENFNLQFGNWRMRINSLLVEAKGKTQDSQHPVTVSVNWFKSIQPVLKRSFNSGGPGGELIRTRELNPSPLLVTILKIKRANLLQQIINVDGAQEWFCFKDVQQTIELSFNIVDNPSQLLDLKVFAVLLFERIE